MPSVYDDDNFSGRVNYAATVILRRGATTRHFDTCFEMNDGSEVAAALMRRAERNPKLRENMPRYLNMEQASEDYRALAHIPTRGLAEHARQTRAKRAKEHAAFMASLD